MLLWIEQGTYGRCWEMKKLREQGFGLLFSRMAFHTTESEH